MNGKSKQSPFEIVDVISADCPDAAKSDAAYQTIAKIAARMLKMKITDQAGSATK